MFVASTQPLQHRVSHELLGVWVPAFAGTTAGIIQKSPGHRPGLFEVRKRSRDQAAGVKTFDALALIGSAVSVAIFLVSSASSLACAVRVSNCLRV